MNTRRKSSDLPHREMIALGLAFALILQCVALLQIAYVDGTPIGSFLFMNLGWSESLMLNIERGAAWFSLVCALTLLVRRSWFAGVPIALWFFLIAIATFAVGGSFAAPYAPVAYAARYTLPLLVVFAAHRPKPFEGLARWSIGATFVAHGVEAWMLHPEFVDYIIAGFHNVLGLRFSESAAEVMLRLIALIDVVVGVLVVLKRWRWVVAWMAIWGAATAVSRMTQLGFSKWPATLLRSAHVAIPLALYLWWRPHRDRSDEEPARST